MRPNPVEQIVLICLLGAFLSGTAPAQRRDRTISQFQHTGWTAKDGAPSPIMNLAQTTDGYLWLTADSGLYRFDGIQFELYKPSSGQTFRSSNIMSLKASADGGLWIGFTYGGADFLKNGRITSFGDAEGLPPGSVLDFALDKQGGVWAGTTEGLARFDGLQWQRIGVDRGYSGKLTPSLFVDHEGTIWVGSEDSLFFLSQGARVFEKCADHLGMVGSIGQTRDGTLWLTEVHADEESRRWPTRATRPIPLLPTAGTKLPPRIIALEHINTLLVDRDNSLWMTSGDGVLRSPYPDQLEENKVFSLDDRPVQKFSSTEGLTAGASQSGPIFEDRDGNIWVGTAHGLDRFREAAVVPILSDHARPLLVAGDQGSVWTHTTKLNQDYLVQFVGMNAHFLPVSISATAGIRDTNGNIWLGGPSGLWHLADDRLTRYPLPDRIGGPMMDVQSMALDRAGRLWVSIVRNGVYRWENGVWTKFGSLQDLPKVTPVSLLTDSAGEIWFGYMGSQMARLDGDRVRTYSSKDGLQVVNIQAIYEHNGRVWVGGERGLALLKDNHFQSLTPDGNAEFAGISGIVETAHGDLWLNASPGIFLISAVEIERAVKEPSHRVHYELFDALDGLTAAAVQLRPLPTLVESSDGRLWFSILGGIVQIDPNHLLRNSVPPSVYIRSIESGAAVYSQSDEIKLAPRTTNVHLEYTAPNLSIPERVQYSYKLEGSDKEWQNAGARREAFYTNLGPGHYNFRVIACNENGVWNNVGATVNFTIAPAWFQTYWFFALCASITCFIAWTLYRVRLRQVAQAMSVRFDDRLSERTRIARDLHDTLLQTIQGSKLAAESALKHSGDPSRMHSALEQLSVWLGRATEEGRAALNSLRTSTTETNDLAEAFRRAIEECRIENSMECSFSVIGDTREMHPIVRDEVYRIGYEAIRNACVHSQASKLQVTLTYAEELGVRVSDNGVGIDPSVADRGKDAHFGLQGMRERAARIAGKLTVTGSPASGTEVKLVVPGKIIYRKTASVPEQQRVHDGTETGQI
jgi:signal transduction histidine kinase